MLISLDVYVVFQAFTISQLKSGRSDAGEFRCAATNAEGDEVDMVKGRMIVVHSESIFYLMGPNNAGPNSALCLQVALIIRNLVYCILSMYPFIITNFMTNIPIKSRNI